MCIQNEGFLLKLGIFSQITDFGKIIENSLKLREILINDKYLVQFIVSVVIKIGILFKITPTA